MKRVWIVDTDDLDKPPFKAKGTKEKWESGNPFKVKKGGRSIEVCREGGASIRRFIAFDSKKKAEMARKPIND